MADTAIKTLRVQKQVFDIGKFEDVTLVKDVAFTKVASVTDALAALGNDNAKLLEIIQVGMEAEARENARVDPSGWHSFKLDETGEPTKELNGAFEGQTADRGDVDANVLTLAKTIFGYNKGMTPEQKRDAKDKAMNLIKNTAAIRDGLVANALAKSKEPTE